MPAASQPAAEVDVHVELVRALLQEQHPDLADRTIEPAAFGWDNVMFRLGDDLAVRMPRRAVAVQLVRNEQRWLPELAPRLPFPVPAPVRVGTPGAGYPWPWTISRWLPGEMAARAKNIDTRELADDLAAFVRALHVPAPAEAPPNPLRGVPLRERDAATRKRLAQAAELVDTDVVIERWEEALEVPLWEGPPLWLHGDLHPANLLVSDGRLSAVIDFGDITAGDPATDLSTAWMVLPPEDRQHLRTEAAVDDATWARARGWALSVGVAMLASSADNEVIAAIGRRTVTAVLEEDRDS